MRNKNTLCEQTADFLINVEVGSGTYNHRALNDQYSTNSYQPQQLVSTTQNGRT
jgi:hypothetical protein